MNLINIAYSGSKAASTQLGAVAMNTANAFTPGYSRQRVELSAVGSVNGMGIGGGVEVTGIRRISDQYLVKQLWLANSSASYYDMSQQYITKLESIIGGESTSLSNGFDKFFAALSEATTQPDSRALRQQMLNEAQSLATRFNNINSSILNQRQSIHDQRAASIANVNTLSSNIASFNQQIIELEANGGNANALRDERDELVKRMSEMADIRVTESSDGSYTVALKNGQPLVSGRNASTLSLKNDASGEQTLELNFSGTTFGVDMSIGGQLGALYDYEVNTLNKMQETIASIAEQFTEKFNEQLGKGYDLKGNPGKPLFVFDPSNPDGMLQVNKLTPEELALSSQPDESGNGDNLKELINIKNLQMDIKHLNKMNLNDATAAIVSNIGIQSRQIQSEAKAAATVLYQAEVQRAGVSGVDTDEEAVNLLTFTQAYQANLKVMATGDKIFSDLLALF